MKNNFVHEFPITSYGLILLKKNEESKELELLMISRKYTVCFIEFLKGKYKFNNTQYLFHLFNQMEQKEIDKLKNNSFDSIWNEVCVYHKINKFSFTSSLNTFNLLKMTPVYAELLKTITNNMPEWGFPKGRKNMNETELECAKREFCEETNYKQNDFEIIENEIYVENIIGTNGIEYKHIYYLAKLVSDKQPYISVNNIHQMHEVGDVKFVNLETALQLIKPYHTNRIEIINELMKKKILFN